MFRLFTAAAFAALLATGVAAVLAIVAVPARAGVLHNSLTHNAISHNALTHNSLTHNSLTHNALTATGSALADLNGVAVEHVVLPYRTSR